MVLVCAVYFVLFIYINAICDSGKEAVKGGSWVVRLDWFKNKIFPHS